MNPVEATSCTWLTLCLEPLRCMIALPHVSSKWHIPLESWWSIHGFIGSEDVNEAIVEFWINWAKQWWAQSLELILEVYNTVVFGCADSWLDATRAKTGLVSFRACPHAGWPAHCTSGAPRSLLFWLDCRRKVSSFCAAPRGDSRWRKGYVLTGGDLTHSCFPFCPL
jgi:hypothetical protein